MSASPSNDLTPSDERGFRVYNAQKLAFPVLLCVPHAGRHYPSEITRNLRIDPAQLQRLEDRYADRLVASAIDSGFPAIIAHMARAWIDLNRSEEELDPQMVCGPLNGWKTMTSAKMRGGLGLIPRRLATAGDIWKDRFDITDVRTRVSSFHEPYHQQIGGLLDQIRAQHGSAVLIDIHSMPPLNQTAGVCPQIIVGDRFGQSASSIYAEILVHRLRQSHIPVALNHPYSGDYVLRRHGRPKKNIHAIQIEFDRSLYLDSNLRDPGSGLQSVIQIVKELAMLLGEIAGNGSTLIAAE